MADNNPKGANTYMTGKVPSRLEVDLVTGGATLYGEEGIFNAFGRTRIATSVPGSPNKWVIEDAFVKKYNNANGTNLSKDEVQKIFNKDLVKQNNNERAAIINKNATDENKTKLSKDTKIPGVVDPVTKTKTENTTDTPTEATDDTDQTDSTTTAADDNDGTYEPTKLTPGESLSGTKNSFANLRYPEDLASSKQDVIRFDMFEYVAGQLNSKDVDGLPIYGHTSGTESLGDSIGSVTLPIPAGISDQNRTNWGSNSMSALDLAKADIATQAIFGSLQQGVESAAGYIEAIKENAKDSASAVGQSLAASAAGVDSQALLARTTGQVMNPNMELLFRGPSLRPFSFKFKLAPRSKTEADNVAKIIRFFKQGMAPIRTESNLFLKSPHIFKLAYIHRGEGGDIHTRLNMFKECALQSFGVNYTPTGNYATYSDGTPVAYDVSMTFSEITPIYNDQYDLDDSLIGF